MERQVRKHELVACWLNGAAEDGSPRENVDVRRFFFLPQGTCACVGGVLLGT